MLLSRNSEDHEGQDVEREREEQSHFAGKGAEQCYRRQYCCSKEKEHGEQEREKKETEEYEVEEKDGESEEDEGEEGEEKENEDHFAGLGLGVGIAADACEWYWMGVWVLGLVWRLMVVRKGATVVALGGVLLSGEAI